MAKSRLRAVGGGLFNGKRAPGTKNLPGAMANVVKNPIEATFAAPANSFVGSVFPGVNPLSMQDHDKVTTQQVEGLMGKVASLETAMPRLKAYGEAMSRYTRLEAEKQRIISDTLTATTRDAAAAQKSIQKVDSESAKFLSEAAIDRQKYEQSMALTGQTARDKFGEANQSYADRLRARLDGIRDRGVAQQVSEVGRQISRSGQAIAAFSAGKGDTQLALNAIRKMPQLHQELQAARAGGGAGDAGEGGLMGLVRKAFT